MGNILQFIQGNKQKIIADPAAEDWNSDLSGKEIYYLIHGTYTLVTRI